MYFKKALNALIFLIIFTFTNAALAVCITSWNQIPQLGKLHGINTLKVYNSGVMTLRLDDGKTFYLYQENGKIKVKDTNGTNADAKICKNSNSSLTVTGHIGIFSRSASVNLAPSGGGTIQESGKAVRSFTVE